MASSVRKAIDSSPAVGMFSCARRDVSSLPHGQHSGLSCPSLGNAASAVQQSTVFAKIRKELSSENTSDNAGNKCNVDSTSDCLIQKTFTKTIIFTFYNFFYFSEKISLSI